MNSGVLTTVVLRTVGCTFVIGGEWTIERGVVRAVSSNRQAEKGLYIPSQLRELRRYCEERSYLVLNEFSDEGISGTTDQRPGYSAT